MSLLDAMSWEEKMLAAHLMMERAAKLPKGDPKARQLLQASRILLNGDPPKDGLPKPIHPNVQQKKDHDLAQCAEGRAPSRGMACGPAP